MFENLKIKVMGLATGIVAFMGFVPQAHAQAITLDPTVQANTIAGVGSLSTIAVSGILGLLPYVLGLVGVLVLISVGFKMLFKHGGVSK